MHFKAEHVIWADHSLNFEDFEQLDSWHEEQARNSIKKVSVLTRDHRGPKLRVIACVTSVCVGGKQKKTENRVLGFFIARAKHRKLRSSVFLCSPIPRDEGLAKGKKRPLKLTKGTIVVREPVNLRWSAVSEREK